MNANVTIKSFPASYGESFLITCYAEKYTKNILIDVGFLSNIVLIVNELKKINSKGQKLDLLIFTHIDNDHINGARELLREISENNIVDVGEIWYNDYYKLLKLNFQNKENVLINKENDMILNQILNRPYPCEKGVFKQGPVGFKTAQCLEHYLMKNEINKIWNASFDYGPVCIGNEVLRKNIAPEFAVVILNPCLDILKIQLKKWEEYLKNMGFDEQLNNNSKLAEAFERIVIEGETENILAKNNKCAANKDIFKNSIDYNRYDDKIVNRTSISIVIEFYDKRLMFLGDASPIEIEDVVKKYVESVGTRKMDVIKIPHHGSRNNWSKVLNETVYTYKYIISTNGRIFKHPDIETIIKLIISSSEKKEIFFNYRPHNLLSMLKNISELEQYQYSIVVENEKSNGVSIQEINI